MYVHDRLATTAIEGNTLSEEEVVKHLPGELKLPPSREYLGQEVDNIIAACNGILSEIRNGRRPVLDFSRVCELNRLVQEKLPLNAGVKPGELRTFDVGVARYRGAPAQDCRFLLERLCEWLNGKEFQPGGGMDLAFAIIKAMLSHLYLAWIHPFADGNGRTARLVEFQILICSGVRQSMSASIMGACERCLGVAMVTHIKPAILHNILSDQNTN